MVLKTVHDKLDDIPEQYRDLYTEKAGKFELTGIVGVKTEADVQRVQKSLDKERGEHKETKAKLTLWGDLEPEETLAKLDKIPALEKAAAGKLDDATIAELANKQADAILKSKLGPVERENAKLKKDLDDASGKVGKLTENEHRRHIADAVRTAAKDLEPTAIEDAIEHGYKVLKFDPESEAVRTRDDMKGVTAGLTAEQWLPEMRATRPHWWKGSQGGGAGGGSGGGGGGHAGIPATINGGKNPFAKASWNLTAQGQLVKQLGEAKAGEIAASVGVKIGATAGIAPAKP